MRKPIYKAVSTLLCFIIDRKYHRN
uniref:Uncharacterized protein n=1 Tax=Rhizophora mucronata TaxID=61149 RepID=A0A2P2P981_RHIMU